MAKKRGHRNHKPKSSKRINARHGEDTELESRYSGDSNSVKGTKPKSKKDTTTLKVFPGGSKKRRGGDSGGLLTNPDEVVQDAKLIERAIRNRWGIKRKRMIVRRLTEVVEKKEVGIPTKEGTFMSDAVADQNAIAAARVLVAMNAQDQEDDHLELKLHKDVPTTVVNVTNNNNVSVDNRRIELARLAESLGASRLLIDGREVEASSYLESADSVPKSEEPLKETPDPTKQ